MRDGEGVVLAHADNIDKDRFPSRHRCRAIAGGSGSKKAKGKKAGVPNWAPIEAVACVWAQLAQCDEEQIQDGQGLQEGSKAKYLSKALDKRALVKDDQRSGWDMTEFVKEALARYWRQRTGKTIQEHAWKLGTRARTGCRWRSHPFMLRSSLKAFFQ
eukprot:jgi/Tetstr1/453630/TSEL_040586.t1